MNKILCLLFFLCSFSGVAQSVTADPALASMKFTNIENIDIFPTQLPLDAVVKLKIPVLNKNISNPLPSGSCKIKIGLGSKLILDPLFNLGSTNTSAYFNWTSIASGGQVQITGELINDLPAGFSDTVVFDVKGILIGASTITSNFLVTNHNNAIFLSDEDGANNTAALAYIITNTVPLQLIDFSAAIKNCNANLKWITDNEVNTSHFEIERSTTITNDWVKIGVVNAQQFSNNRTTYNFTDINLPVTNGKILYRLKMVDRDNSFKYSKVLPVFANCNKVQVNLYPNPVTKGNLNISLNGFSKNVMLVLKAITGEIIATKTVENGTHILDVSSFSNGIYLLSLSDMDGNIRQLKVAIQN